MGRGPVSHLDTELEIIADCWRPRGEEGDELFLKGRDMQEIDNIRGTKNIIYVRKQMERIVDGDLTMPHIPNGFPVSIYGLPLSLAGARWVAAIAVAGNHAGLLYIDRQFDPNEVFRRALEWIGRCDERGSQGQPTIVMAGTPRIFYNSYKQQRG